MYLTLKNLVEDFHKVFLPQPKKKVFRKVIYSYMRYFRYLLYFYFNW